MPSTLPSTVSTTGTAETAPADIQRADTGPTELTPDELIRVAGGLGPAGTWSATTTQGPAGTW